jgi:hypothetical protein
MRSFVFLFALFFWLFCIGVGFWRLLWGLKRSGLWHLALILWVFLNFWWLSRVIT